MSQGNLEVLRPALEAVGRREFDAALEALDEDVEIRQPPEFPGPGTFHGHEGYLRAVGELEDAAENMRYELRELVGEGDVAVATIRFSGRTRHTGLELETLVYWVYRFRGGKVVRMEAHLDRGAAEEAAGISASRD
jgi:ketosteroid isomerase-like protein